MEAIGLLLLCFAGSLRAEETQTGAADEQRFLQAALDGYDDNKSFTENFYSLLGIICPSSVYCTENETSENVFSDEDYEPAHVSEARKILGRNRHKLRGCCVRCECDTDCVERQNCCPAAEKHFNTSSGSKRDGQVIQECVAANIRSYLPKRHTRAGDEFSNMYFMVTDCFSKNFSEQTANKCRNPDANNPTEAVPVYSNDTERIYKNIFCAECNNDVNVTIWQSLFMFGRNFQIFKISSFTPEMIYSMVVKKQREVDLHFKAPANLPIDRKNFFCTPNYDKRQCSDNLVLNDLGKRNFFKRACAMHESLFKSVSSIYKNVFCFLCAVSNIYGERVCDVQGRGDAISFSAVLNFKGLKPEDQPEKEKDLTGSHCKCSEYYDEKKKTCRELVCPPAEYFVECACVEFLKDIKQIPVEVHLQVTHLLHSNIDVDTIEGELNTSRGINTFKENLNKMLDVRWGPIEFKYSVLFRHSSTSGANDITIYVLLGVVFSSGSDDRAVMKDMFAALEAGMPAKLLNISMRISIGPIFDFLKCINGLPCDLKRRDGMVPLEPELQTVTDMPGRHRQILSKLLFCRRIYLEEHEIAALHYNSLKQSLALGYVFRKKDGSMCLDDFVRTFSRSASPKDFFLDMTTSLVWFTTLLFYHIM